MDAQERRHFELSHVIVAGAFVEARRAVKASTRFGSLLGKKPRTLFSDYQEIDISVVHSSGPGSWKQTMTFVTEPSESMCGAEVEIGQNLDLALRGGLQGHLTADHCSQQIAKGLQLF